MRARTLEKWIWVAVYAGLIAIGLGLAVARQDAGIGHPLAVAGGLLVVLGGGLVVLRSRRKDEP